MYAHVCFERGQVIFIIEQTRPAATFSLSLSFSPRQKLYVVLCVCVRRRYPTANSLFIIILSLLLLLLLRLLASSKVLVTLATRLALPCLLFSSSSSSSLSSSSCNTASIKGIAFGCLAMSWAAAPLPQLVESMVRTTFQTRRLPLALDAVNVM